MDAGNVSNVTSTASQTLTSKIFIGIGLYSLVTVTVLGNLFVLIAVLIDKRLQTVFNYYIVNLAVTDVLVALMAMSLYTTDNILGYWPLGEFMCGVWIFFDYGMTFASVFTLVVISMDRFWSVQWSVHYRQHHNKRKAGLLILVVWMAMLVLWLPPCITDRVKNSEPGICKWEPSNNREFVIVVAALGHHAACLLLFFCYIKVFVFMRKRASLVSKKNKIGTVSGHVDAKEAASAVETTLPAQDGSLEDDGVSNVSSGAATVVTVVPGNQPGQKSKGNFLQLPTGKGKSRKPQKAEANDKRERKVFVTLSYIIFGYMICWVPFHIVFDISAFDPTTVPEVIYTITFWMTYLNSTINPFLYNFSSPEFRQAFKRILCCDFARR